MRQFHRPLLHVHGGMVLPMQLPKELNKKKLKKNKKLGVQLIQNPSDISLLDQCEFVLLEYSVRRRAKIAIKRKNVLTFSLLIDRRSSHR